MDIKKENLRKFCQNYRLTPRESEVLEKLIEGIEKLSELSSALESSPNTVNNHLKSIFRKTKNHSKAELLASYFQEFINDQIHLMSPPFGRVLIVDDEKEFVDLLVKELQCKGFEVQGTCHPENALDEIQDFYPDIVVLDLRMPHVSGLEILSSLRKQSGLYPFVIFVSGYSDYNKEQLLNFGSVDFVNKPIDIDALCTLLFKYLFWPKDLVSCQDEIEETKKIYCHNISLGNGGVFIPFGDNTSLVDKKEGEPLWFEFKLEGQLLSGQGEVVWKRQRQQNDLMPGLGVRFSKLDKKCWGRLKSYVRKNANSSFIPISSENLIS